MILDDLTTPCLLVEKQRLEANLEAMQAKATANRVALRPHVKTHKSVWMARHQRGLGAQNLTVATLHEAEVFAEAGFDDIRIAYPVVGEDKLSRVLQLMDRVPVSFCVDTEAGAQMASDFFAAHGQPADVLIEVDTGHGRTGVPYDDPDRVAFARFVSALPGLSLVGVLTHEGHAYHGPREGETPNEALHRVATEARDRLLAVAADLRAADLPEAQPGRFDLSLGSTPSTAAFENAERDGFTITEVRPGNYVFNDATQVALGAATLADCALTALATVVSKHRDRDGSERLYLDAGKKVLTSDTGVGTTGYGVLLYNAVTMRPLPHAQLVGLSEEHGWVEVRGGATMDVGDRVRLVPNHACVAVATQDRLFLVDGQEVLHDIAVDARGHA